ncbi:VOC family protein [Devosia sp.]|uniref:VOC family protein n=1 Tax=Devosia sp. TaxID=1871048 RepID=UPI001AC8885A|nr:VOC family protein [Devosia sp.]MBN9334290.1 VOC family protein [Devosia sp.]
MAKVLGVGGFFFRARDKAGLTVFAPFKETTDYFPADKQWMINFRVDDLDGMIAQLQAAGIAVETRPEEWDTPETGRFARIHDPEGNQIELWEPAPQSS